MQVLVLSEFWSHPPALQGEETMAKKAGRIGENGIRNLVLEIIRNEPNGEITTTKLISELRRRLPLSAEDEERLKGRNDDRFSQIVRNIKSHKNQPGNLIYDGHLIDIKDGFRTS